MSEALRKAAEQALKALDLAQSLCEKSQHHPTILCAYNALRAALAEPEQPEPFYMFRRKGFDEFCTCDERRYLEMQGKPNLFEVAIFYRETPRREPLTEQQIKEMWRKHAPNIGGIFDFAAEVEQYHGIKP